MQKKELLKKTVQRAFFIKPKPYCFGELSQGRGNTRPYL